MILLRQSRERNEASTDGESLALGPVRPCLRRSWSPPYLRDISLFTAYLTVLGCGSVKTILNEEDGSLGLPKKLTTNVDFKPEAWKMSS
ncbi:hypothetical protein TNCV_4198231 [Trichonephila clavipes]|nr:hypothetical protein TNCV_4198231 [Trichonephila clavipes]